MKTEELKKFDAARFAPFWNEIIKNLREEDYITNLWVEILMLYISFYTLLYSISLFLSEQGIGFTSYAKKLYIYSSGTVALVSSR